MTLMMWESDYHSNDHTSLDFTRTSCADRLFIWGALVKNCNNDYDNDTNDDVDDWSWLPIILRHSNALTSRDTIAQNSFFPLDSIVNDDDKDDNDDNGDENNFKNHTQIRHLEAWRADRLFPWRALMSDCGNPLSHPPSDCATNIFSLQTFSTLAIRVVRNYDYLDLKRNDVYKPYQQYSSTSKRINLRLAE